MQPRMGFKKEVDPRGYLESEARPSEVNPVMKQNNAALQPSHMHGLMPPNHLNNKMNGE